VFSRAAFVPRELDPRRAVVIPPSIDPFSTKNQPLTEAAVRAILAHTGLVAGAADPPQWLVMREGGTPGRVDRRADILRVGAPPAWERPLVVQVSRWDRLKDPIGVLHGFVRVGARGAGDAELVLAGPNVRSVADDPEGATVYDSVFEAWRTLPE